MREIGAVEGRGGQTAPQAHFTLDPGNYRVEVRYSSGVTKSRDIEVGDKPLWLMEGEK
jgi:hypothetical protein